jgi:hypothetical protein
VEADVVIPVPDSGVPAAIGYAQQAGIPFEMGLIRNHYVGRTFIMPEQGKRTRGIDMKLSILPEVVQGKRVVMVDDSIVRGNTVQRRVSFLREAGALEVHVRISCPPIRHPCFFGIDFATTTDNTFYFDDVEGPEYGAGVVVLPLYLPITFDDAENQILLTLKIRGQLMEAASLIPDYNNHSVQQLLAEITPKPSSKILQHKPLLLQIVSLRVLLSKLIQKKS